MPNTPTTITIPDVDLQKLELIAHRIADCLQAGDAVILSGALATGKTQFVKYLSNFLEIKDVVTSPTFTLVHFYQGGRLSLIHVDAYRLESEAEYNDLTLDNFLDNHAILIEWGDKFRNVLPPALDVTFSPAGEGRRTVVLTSGIPHWKALFAELPTKIQTVTP